MARLTESDLKNMGLVEVNGKWVKTNAPVSKESSSEKPVLTNSPTLMVFLINPQPAPRMSSSDRYKKRPIVQRYWNYKDELKAQARKANFQLPCSFKVTFFMPFPESYSKTKRLQLEGRPHQQRPDIDNMLKGLQDCLLDEDGKVWRVHASKVWSSRGYIQVEEI